MITPTRFGLKFAPTPTLALEYETDVASSLSEVAHEAATTTQSLFVYKAKSLSGTSRKRLHVVELPQLTRQSDAATIARELQADDYRFLGPDIVNLSQLRRLLQRLVDHLQQQQLLPPQTSVEPTNTPRDESDHESEPTNKPRDESDHEGEQAMEDSFLDESIAEASTSMQQHHEESADDPPPMVRDPKPAEGSRGRFVTAEEGDEEEEEEETRRTTTTRQSDDSPSKSDHEESEDHTTVPVQTKVDTSLGTAEEQDKEEEQEDADDVELKKDVEAKKAALRADDEDDEELEEEVQSEELEYFSEDASDEDSF
ncbi:hypothetical protein P43SY_005739 [Pythium insidiosum]|uniref:Uncharacterized protein n=1 Tax=Pythium insidiosum TaxID=114742 RepID=A0AAD5LR08_PYTIN|nr:hypothetical protein P43SY_005739 [Pythium insidiosum]